MSHPNLYPQDLSLAYFAERKRATHTLLLPIFLVSYRTGPTVLYFRDPPTGHHSLSSNGYYDHAISHRKIRCVFFKPWGSNLSQFFRIQFKVVRL